MPLDGLQVENRLVGKVVTVVELYFFVVDWMLYILQPYFVGRLSLGRQTDVLGGVCMAPRLWKALFSWDGVVGGAQSLEFFVFSYSMPYTVSCGNGD